MGVRNPDPCALALRRLSKFGLGVTALSLSLSLYPPVSWHVGWGFDVLRHKKISTGVPRAHLAFLLQLSHVGRHLAIRQYVVPAST